MKVFQSHAAQALGVSDAALCELDDLFGHQPCGRVVNQTQAQCRASAFKRHRHSVDDFWFKRLSRQKCTYRHGSPQRPCRLTHGDWDVGSNNEQMARQDHTEPSPFQTPFWRQGRGSFFAEIGRRRGPIRSRALSHSLDFSAADNRCLHKAAECRRC